MTKMNYSLRNNSFLSPKHYFLIIISLIFSVPGISQQMKDNALVDLTGHVKECVVVEHNSKFGTNVYRFNEPGVLLDGIPYMANVKREKGYIVEYTVLDIEKLFGGDVIYKIEYSNGKIIREASANDVTTYTYNNQGYCTKKITSSAGKSDVSTYNYLSYDKKGNWLKREKISDGEKSIEERLITYYGEPKQHIMGFPEIINTLPQECKILKVADLNERPDDGSKFYGRDDYKYYHLHRFNLIDYDGNPSNYEYIEYLKCNITEKGDTTVNARGIIRSIEEIYPDLRGKFVGIYLSKDNINDYTPLSGKFSRDFAKELTELFINTTALEDNNKAININPNYNYWDDLIWYKINMKIPTIKEVKNETNDTSIKFNLIGHAPTYDLIITKDVGYSSNFGAIYSVIKTINNVQSPYILQKNTLEKGDYKVFFIENNNGIKRKSDSASFSIY